MGRPRTQPPPQETAPVPPSNLEAEFSLLGAMMLSSAAIEAALDVSLSPRDFYRLSNGVIYQACVSLYAESLPVDHISVVERLIQLGTLERVEGGRDNVRDLALSAVSASNARHYAQIVREKAVLRSMMSAGDELRRLALEGVGGTAELVDQAEKAVFDLAMTGRTGEFVPLAEPVTAAIKHLQELGENRAQMIGIPSGYRAIDNLTSGFQPGNLIVLAARPSMGKSALALNICSHVAVSLKKTVALFTLEMSRYEVSQRMIGSEAMVESQHLRSGRIDPESWKRIGVAGAKLTAAPVVIDDSGSLTAMELRAKARRLKLSRPDLAMIIVDYLQLMTSGAERFESRQQDVSQISRALKVLSGELDIPVVALSQLSRAVEQRHDKRPMLADLRDSGSIEQDADLVLFLYRDEYYHPEDTDQEGIAEVHVAKHRNGPTGMGKLVFVKRHTMFSDLPVGQS